MTNTLKVQEELTELSGLANFPVAAAHGIGAIALTMAMKYHGINTVQDGALYQQYKLEGKNMHALTLDEVFETAMRIEAHLLATSERIASIVVDALAVTVKPEATDDA